MRLPYLKKRAKKWIFRNEMIYMYRWKLKIEKHNTKSKAEWKPFHIAFTTNWSEKVVLNGTSVHSA